MWCLFLRGTFLVLCVFFFNMGTRENTADRITSVISKTILKCQLAVGLIRPSPPPPPFNETWLWLRVESWVDSESNAFHLGHESIWIEKLGGILCHASILFDSQGSRSSHESIWINTWGSAWVVSWFWVNSLEGRLSHELNRFNSLRYWDTLRFNSEPWVYSN